MCIYVFVYVDGIGSSKTSWLFPQNRDTTLRFLKAVPSHARAG